MSAAAQRRRPPRIITPDFWPATFDRFDELLVRAYHCTIEHIGTSAGNRAIHGVTWRGRNDMPTFGLVGGMHGHEPQGPAACFNVISVLQTGRDLKGESWPEITPDLNYVIVPLLNPDARARMPNSFVGLARQDILHYDAGMTLEGVRQDSGDEDCDPSQMMVLGGLFNEAGNHVNRETDPENIRSPEIRALMSFVADHKPDLVLEFHAHAAPPMLIAPVNLVPPEVQDRQAALTEAVIRRAREEGIDFNEEVPKSEKLSTSLYHHFGGSVPVLYESPQGVLDSPCPWEHERIIDTCLFVVSCLAAELVKSA